ncbi:MAG: hypothetical protein VYD76_07840 [Pseudomonadota bacterium]|nr:hypothetical protein [Pseudomonadota bacterium]
MTGCHVISGRWIVLVLCCLVSPVIAATSLDAFVTSSIENGVPVSSLSNEFNCADKIFSVIDIQGLRNGEHTLNVDWIDPSGKRREQTTYSFHRAGSIRITVWLKLHPPRGATLLSAFNPALGMGEFIGRWEIRMRVDQSPLAQKWFSVLC